MRFVSSSLRIALATIVAGGMLFVSTATAAEWGSLKGKFIFEGKAPDPKVLDTSKDKPCCGKFKVLDETVVVGKNNELANVVIYVRSKKPAIHPDYAKNVKPKLKLDNTGCRFEPHIQGIWYTKQQLDVANSDQCLHNSLVQPLLDKAENFAIQPGTSQPYKYAREQNIPQPISCGVHPWMKCYVLPRSNPYFAVSGPDGTFKIENLPAGELEFQVWHEALGFLATPEWKQGRFKLKIKAGENKLGKEGVVKITASNLKLK